MKMLRLFEMALSIQEPWYVKGITFKEDENQLDIKIDFKRGSKFYYHDESSGQEGYYPVHDSVEKRWRTPEDLQGVVVFLASPASDYMQGYTVAVDGGWLAR